MLIAQLTVCMAVIDKPGCSSDHFDSDSCEIALYPERFVELSSGGLWLGRSNVGSGRARDMQIMLSSLAILKDVDEIDVFRT